MKSVTSDCGLEVIYYRSNTEYEAIQAQMEALAEGVDEEGIVQDLECETYYCEFKGLLKTDKYLRVTGDNRLTDVEIRIPLEFLTSLGWIPPTE